MREEVILVDKTDKPIGVMEKLEAHQKGFLHRAFSVFIFNHKGELLLQQRALNKYHSAGLWTNTCCSHPRPNEDTLAAAHRRLMEEMGLETELVHKTHFIYRTGFENGLIEHEFDHIYFGDCSQKPQINKNEVEAFVWMHPQKVILEINNTPEKYTSWFKIAMQKLF
ncbi:MAG: isopentenyl-diphosphate Delta-isomerase [Bacteroidetes bacterium]|nr:isopentenyl-diphosphate Delta-isomerase [Bacteroidota bacterium]